MDKKLIVLFWTILVFVILCGLGVVFLSYNSQVNKNYLESIMETRDRRNQEMGDIKKQLEDLKKQLEQSGK